MIKYPVAVRDRKLQVFMQELVDLHVRSGDRILDPTPGEGLQWKGVQVPEVGAWFLNGKRLQEIELAAESVNVVFFDPPYLSVVSEFDGRSHTYGGYRHPLGQIRRLVSESARLFSKWVKVDGKVIFKCSDQYSRGRYSALTAEWVNTFELYQFRVIDHQYMIHHHISPTAWQILDRNCAVINCTQFLVFQKQYAPKRPYVIGPMAGYENLNRDKFDEVSEREGVFCRSAVEVGREQGYEDGTDNPPDEEVAVLALRELINCTEVVVLPGWERSRGCQMELALAQFLKKPVRYVK